LNAINAGEKEQQINEYLDIFTKLIILDDSCIFVSKKINGWAG